MIHPASCVHYGIPHMKIYIPHLDYTIITKPFKAHSAVPNAQAYVERIDDRTSYLYLQKKNTPPGLAHEVVHILQNICADRDMNFIIESEHMAYLMQYILGELLGYEWIPTK